MKFKSLSGMLVTSGMVLSLLLSGCASDGGSQGGSGSHPIQLNDLVDMRARNLDGEMADRGFRNTGGYKEHGASKTLWHNGSTGQCVSITTREGHVANIESIIENNCL